MRSKAQKAERWLLREIPMHEYPNIPLLIRQAKLYFGDEIPQPARFVDMGIRRMIRLGLAEKYKPYPEWRGKWPLRLTK